MVAETHQHGDQNRYLLIENAVLYTTGGEENTLIALNKKDGSLIWKTKSLGGAKSYASASINKSQRKENNTGANH